MNLRKSGNEALKSLCDRVKSGEVIIVETDKSGKFSAISPEVYLAMGHKHTSNDVQKTWGQLEAIQNCLNCHTSM